ncbi:hypothetical protein WA026_017300 [Henosepilachna vigintioctopunctata]|uniref:Uncharacterized protein n=1 Tax=Henosepilachna vigintioctopunctata TaxID=420089 RepID=A0AAW1UMQ7_9CUCU
MSRPDTSCNYHNSDHLRPGSSNSTRKKINEYCIKYKMNEKLFVDCVLILVILTFVKCESKKNETIKLCLYTSQTKKVCDVYESVQVLKDQIVNGSYLYLESVNDNLQTLPENFLTNIDNIQEIWLARNNISAISPGAFKNLSYTSISLNENRIKRIESGVFTNLTEIFSILLARNLIEFIDKDAFSNMTNLREINLSHNRLKYWNSDWFSGSQLVHLDASYNSIEKLPNASFKFAQSHGKIVHKISMKYNRIKMLSNDTFFNLPEASYLYFSNNKISKVDEDIMRYTNATYFDLTGNLIECLPKNLEHFLRAQCISLKNNPLSCPCYEAILNWQTKNSNCVYHNFNKYCPSSEIE